MREAGRLPPYSNNGAALASAARMQHPLLVTTLTYCDLDDFRYVERYQAAMGPGSEILPVFVHCPEDEIERRIGAPDRVELGKLSSMAMLRNMLYWKPSIPIPLPNSISIDTSTTSPEEAARTIVDRFELHNLPEAPLAFLEEDYRNKAAEIEATGLRP